MGAIQPFSDLELNFDASTFAARPPAASRGIGLSRDRACKPTGAQAGDNQEVNDGQRLDPPAKRVGDQSIEAPRSGFYAAGPE